MRDLRNRYNAFVSRNSNKGIPHLMTFICIINAIVFFYSLIAGTSNVYQLLSFRVDRILRGEVWRLFSYVFTFALSSGFLGSRLIGAFFSILFYFWLGTILEQYWGTLRFNLYYFSGILLTDLFAFLIYAIFPTATKSLLLYTLVSVSPLNLTLFLAVATIAPDTQVLLLFIIPIKMKFLGLFYLVIMVLELLENVIQFVIPVWQALGTAYGLPALLYILLPFVTLGNYFLYFGKRWKALLPNFRSGYRQQQRRADYYRGMQGETSRREEFRRKTEQAQRTQQARPYRHKCTVCGRTDTDYPDLEFRYCSKCRGYYCYCIDHINNHTHIQ